MTAINSRMSVVDFQMGLFMSELLALYIMITCLGPTAIFQDCQNGNFQMKKCYIFLIFAQNIDHGYPRSKFKSKNKKIRKNCTYTPVNSSFTILQIGVQGGINHTDNFAALFNCMSVDRASDSLMTPHTAIHFSTLGSELFRLLLGPQGLN